MRSETFLLHGAYDPDTFGGVVNPPVYRASTIVFRDMEDMETRAKAMSTPEGQELWYGRKGTPTTFALQEMLAGLEGGHRSLLVSSGLAACTSAIMAFARTGDHILICDSVYGPTRQFADTVLKRCGVTVTYYDPLIGPGIRELFRPNTTVVFLESPGSQSFEVQDVPGICAEARRRGAKVVMDNTWATPLFFKPFEHGVDVSVHAATKYIVGHSDATMGVITANRETWSTVREYVFAAGLHAGADDVYLAQRGLRTMAVRLERHFRQGVDVAMWLAGRPEVERVLHPALPEAPGHAFWARDYTGASGLFSVVLKPGFSREAFRTFIDSLKLFGLGFSWGGYESLVMPFDPRHERPGCHWPYDGFSFRLHIGLEAREDLIEDLEKALRFLHAR
ncbi:cystathionine beta-lyase [Paraburkholderia phymatum]|uniref:Cystathionine beta-lyase n=1 Tax=Paraburkholderia phymatum (strain DSM 17167 / CIP 108236 / LMG 21445 / STM815) TaxID=391038 RepID=B2JP06_PARP8|nr:cystathionine beta-lyase [Paraburkholderia phymatum]ACC74559.1 cystathionine beta-lyase [Paraburkholderia phymatum STM815]